MADDYQVTDMTTERERFDAWLSQFPELAPLYGPVLWEAWCAALSAPAVPQWVLVPVEPTQEMCAAAVRFANGNAVYKNVTAEVLKIEEGIYGEVYAAMLAAAPSAKEPT